LKNRLIRNFNLFFLHISRLALILLSFSSYTSALAGYIQLPSSGETQSYALNDDAGLHGQAWPNPRFIGNGDGTLSDQLTGLMWLVDANCAHTSGFLSGGGTHSLEVAKGFVAQLNQSALAQPCKAYSANYTDWRLPNAAEIFSLMPAGQASENGIVDWLNNPPDHSKGFENVNTNNSVRVWTENFSNNQTMNDITWIANLIDGHLQADKRINPDPNAHNFIFSAVRINNAAQKTPLHFPTNDETLADIHESKGVLWPQPRFFERAPGIILDRLTGLEWMSNIECLNQALHDWSSALAQVNVLNQAQIAINKCQLSAIKTDWRLPNIRELSSLLDYSVYQFALLPVIHSTNYDSGFFWSSTSANRESDAAWSIALGLPSNINARQAKTSAGLVWPTRNADAYVDIQVTPVVLHLNAKHPQSQQTFTVKNTGQDHLIIDSIKLSDRDNFSINQDYCSQQIIASKETCTISLNYHEQKLAIRAKLTIKSNAIATPTSIAYLDNHPADWDNSLNENCFIATAAYGSYFSPQVKVLRKFRDQILLNSSAGHRLVEFYYQYSPAVAAFIQNSNLLKAIVIALLTPLVYALQHPLSAILLLSIVVLFYQRQHLTLLK